MTVHAEIVVVPMGDPEPGWCDPCALPSAVVQTFELFLPGHDGPGRLWTVRYCPDCGSTLGG